MGLPDEIATAAEAVRRNVTARLLACEPFEIQVIDYVLGLVERARDSRAFENLGIDGDDEVYEEIIRALIRRETGRDKLRAEAAVEIAGLGPPAICSGAAPSATAIARSHAAAVTDAALGGPRKNRPR